MFGFSQADFPEKKPICKGSSPFGTAPGSWRMIDLAFRSIMVEGLIFNREQFSEAPSLAGPVEVKCGRTR
jgi:hypothetical protein